jgi:hypothetical protein
VSHSNRPTSRAEPPSDQAVDPLLERYVASIREPVEPSDLFRPPPSSSVPAAAQPRRRGIDPTAPEGWMLLLYAAGLVFVLVAAAMILLAA